MEEHNVDDSVVDAQKEKSSTNKISEDNVGVQEEKSSTDQVSEDNVGTQKGKLSTYQISEHNVHAQKAESSTSQISEHTVDAQKAESSTSQIFEDSDWQNYRDSDIMQQHSAIQAEEALKMPFIGDKESLSSLAAEYKSGGNPILLEKIKILNEKYVAMRRTRGDGNCFFRSFMFAYLEYILGSQDQAEVKRITANVEECKRTLLNLGYAEFTFEDFFSLFLELLESVIQGSEASISHDELVKRCRDQSVSDYVVMFFRFITSGEIRKRSEFFEPFILGLTNGTVEQFCKSAVEPMGEESDHVHITALSDALGVAIRVVYLDRSSYDKGSVSVNHHDFVPCEADGNDSTSSTVGSSTGAVNPVIILLYRPGHYDILYPQVI